MYPRNLPQRDDDRPRQQNSAPPSRIFCAVPPPKQYSRNETSTIHTLPYPQLFPAEQPTSPSWYYIGPKGTSINNHYENGLIRVAAPSPSYVYPVTSNFITNNPTSTSYGYPQQLWRPTPPFGDPNRSMYYYHPQPGASISAKNTFHPSLEAKDEGYISKNKETKIGCNPAVCNCLVISLSASIITLLMCFGVLVTYIVTQPTFLQLEYPSQPQQPAQTSINDISQQMQKQPFPPSTSPIRNNNYVEQTLDDFSLAFADKATTMTPVVSPVVAAPYKDIPQPSHQGKNDYYDFIEAFQGSALSIVASKPTLAPFPASTAPIKDTAGTKSTTDSSHTNGTKVDSVTFNTTFFGNNNSTSIKNSSQNDTKSTVPVPSQEQSYPTSAPAALTSSNSRVKTTPAPTTKDGYYYYYYYTEKPVKKNDKSTNSTTSEKTKTSTSVNTAESRTSDVTLDAVLSSLSSTNRDTADSFAVTSTASSSSPDSNIGNWEATPTPSPYSSNNSGSSNSQSQSQSSELTSYDEPTPSPSPSSSGEDSQLSNLDMDTFQFSSDSHTMSTKEQQLPGTLLGAISDDDANVSVYGNAKSTIPCDLLMCDDAADDDLSDTEDSSTSERGGVTYDFSGNGILPGPYDTVTMTSASSSRTDGTMTSNPIEQIVGTPITQHSKNVESNNTDDGLCWDC